MVTFKPVGYCFEGQAVGHNFVGGDARLQNCPHSFAQSYEFALLNICLFLHQLTPPQIL
jgi:hypothetical protein